MSEYQYYEFRAVDRPLGAGDREALRAISTRATITATSFKNTYEWGDLKGDPVRFMERWFDLHLYLANWASRRLMIRLPKRVIDRVVLASCIRETDEVTLHEAGENLILDIGREEEPDDDWDDGSAWLAALAPLRADLLGGDQRLFYLFWLMAVERDIFADGTPEPLPGLGPLSASLAAFVEFFAMDKDLVAAAAERAPCSRVSSVAARAIVAGLDDGEKTDLLMRLLDHDPHVGGELARRVRAGAASSSAALLEARTVAQLRRRAATIRKERLIAAQEAAAAEKARQAEVAARERRLRLDGLQRRGDGVWRDVETEIERHNAVGYNLTVQLLRDLHALSGEQGSTAEFVRRLEGIRTRHASKRSFIKRIDGIAA